MSRASRARRIATAAAFGAGGLGGVGALGGAALYGLIVGETKLARRRIPAATGIAPLIHDTTWAAEGVSASRPPIRLALMGDSTAAGYGVHRDRDTPGVRLAIGISTVARRPVHLTNVAVVGADSRELPSQLARLGDGIELAVIMVGANDVTHRVKPEDSVRALSETVQKLVTGGAEVVVGTCPDLGTVRPIAQPLRFVARRVSRGLAAAQTVAVVEAGGRTVSLGDLLGPLFARSRDMWADDRFHPSAAGYAAAADAILPSALDALGLRTRTSAATPFSSQRARPVAKAAARAASVPGTEVAASSQPNRRRVPVGPLAVLVRRRPQQGVRTAPESARPLDAGPLDAAR